MPLAFHRHEDLLGHPDIDAVAVVVRVPLHYRLTMDVLRCREAQEMATLARTRGVHTMVGLQGRFAPAFRRLKELLDEGYVGEVLACHLTQIRPSVLNRTSGRTWQRDQALGATTLTIPFGHAVDCMCMCVGEFSEVSAVVSTQAPQWHETDTNRGEPPETPGIVGWGWRAEAGRPASALELFGIRVGGDELAGFDIIDVGITHLDARGFFLQEERNAAVFVTPATIDPLDGDLFGQVGDGHRHVEFAAQLIGQGNVFPCQGEHKAGVVEVLTEHVPGDALMQIPQASR